MLYSRQGLNLFDKNLLALVNIKARLNGLYNAATVDCVVVGISVLNLLGSNTFNGIAFLLGVNGNLGAGGIDAIYIVVNHKFAIVVRILDALVGHTVDGVFAFELLVVFFTA